MAIFKGMKMKTDENHAKRFRFAFKFGLKTGLWRPWQKSSHTPMAVLKQQIEGGLKSFYWHCSLDGAIQTKKFLHMG